MYNYNDEMRKDVIQAIAEMIRYNPDICEIEDRYELESRLNDELFCDDSVTGNASGSYYCNSYKAAEALHGNEWIAEEAAEDFGIDANTIANHIFDYEYWDVTIRCYLLSGVISDVVEEIESLIENYGEIETLADAIETLKAA